ncbi:hypothetical protein TOK_2986 [Pseudonocardia sp. N23]|nr:hypothetical protein TOK_2986 [Pseudonocardia sp. N23]
MEPLVRSPATGGGSVALKGGYPPPAESIQSNRLIVQISSSRTLRSAPIGRTLTS